MQYLAKIRRHGGGIFRRTRIGLAIGATAMSTLALAAENQLEEVIVTAQKRDQLQSEVPLALSAISGDQLERSGIVDVRDIFHIAPSVTFNSSVNPGGDTLRIRGVGSPGFASGVEQSVGVVIDGVVTGSSGSGLSSMWDVAHIEVLRGPQGTLFGKNTSAGAISVVTRAPTDVFEAYTNIRYENTYQTTRTEAGVSGPLTDAIRARVSGFYSDQQKGMVDEVVRDSETNLNRSMGVRLRTDYQMDDFTADLSLSYNRNDNKCCTVTFTRIDPYFIGKGGAVDTRLIPAAQANGMAIKDSNRDSIADAPEHAKEEVWHLAYNMSWDLANDHTLTSITGYRSWRESDRTDSEKLPVDLVNNTYTQRHLKLYTQEFQYVSPSGADLEYVMGLFFFHQTFDEVQNTGGRLLGNDLAEMTMSVDNAAIFGHTTYHFNDRWAAFGGARLLWERFRIKGERHDNPYPGLQLPAYLYDGGGNIAQSDTAWTGTAGVQFFPAVDQMMYASISRGYKGAGVDTAPSGAFFSSNINTSPVLDPETVVSFEMGSKNRWWDGRMTTSVVAFLSYFDDFHASSFDSSSNGILLRNAGKIKTQGIEFDATFIPWDSARVTLSGAYIDARFDEYENAPCTSRQTATSSCKSQDLSGKRVNNAPEFQYTISAQQDFPIPGTLGGYVAADYGWRSSFIFNGDLDPYTKQDAYGVANFRLGVMPTQNVEVVTFLQNAFNTNYALRILPAPVVTGAYSAQLAPERTWGVELRLKY